MPGVDVVAVRTDAGMLSVWCPQPFAAVNGYDAWEQYVNDRLQDAIANGELVPVNIGSDGAWGVRVAVAPDGLTERERAYAVVTSEPYLLVVSGGEACLSGIEAVGDPAFAALRIPLADGHYAIRSTILAWDGEPGAFGADGCPTASALSDFVIQIAPELGNEKYRTTEVTFDARDASAASVSAHPNWTFCVREQPPPGPVTGGPDSATCLDLLGCTA